MQILAVQLPANFGVEVVSRVLAERGGLPLYDCQDQWPVHVAKWTPPDVEHEAGAWEGATGGHIHNAEPDPKRCEAHLRHPACAVSDLSGDYRRITQAVRVALRLQVVGNGLGHGRGLDGAHLVWMDALGGAVIRACRK